MKRALGVVLMIMVILSLASVAMAGGPNGGITIDSARSVAR